MNLNKLKCIAIFAKNIEKIKKLIYIFIFKKFSLSIVYRNCGHEYEKIFEKEKLVEILKIRGLIDNIEECQKIFNHVWRKHKSRV